MKIFKHRTKLEIFGAIFIVILLVAISVMAGTRVITDSSDNIETFIQCSSGNYYLAIGDNIATAINDGEVVRLPPGNFTISSTIYLKNDTQLIGCGNATILYLADNVNASVLRANSMHNIVVRDLLIDGNMNNNCNGYSGGILFRGCKEVIVERVTCINIYSNAISTDQDASGDKSENIIVEKCFINTINGDAGIRMYLSQNFSVALNHISNSYYGIIISMSDYGTVIGNVITDGNGADNIDAGVGAGWGIATYSSDFVTISANTIINMSQSVTNGSGGVGININNAVSNSVCANTITLCDGAGIYTVGGSTLTSITGNTIRNNCRGTGFHSEITLDDNYGRNTVSGNTISESGTTKCDYLLNISNANCNNNLISGNTLAGVASNHMANFTSSNNLVIGNTGYFTIFSTFNVTTFQAGFAWVNGNGLLIKTSSGWINLTDYSTGIEIGNSTSYFSVNETGYLTLHGNARVERHADINAGTWIKHGLADPGTSAEGLFCTLDFDKATNETVYYTFHIPWRRCDNTNMEVSVYWFHDTNASDDTKKVMWAVDYVSIEPGETVDAINTTITQLSAGNHNTDAGELIYTTFTTKIIAGNLANHDNMGIRFYRVGTDGSDDLNEDARLMSVHLHFTMDKLGELIG